MTDDSSVLVVEREMASYYDAEEGREARVLDPRRITARDRFVTLVGVNGLGGPTLEIGRARVVTRSRWSRLVSM